jgi:hypothetical protein
MRDVGTVHAGIVQSNRAHIDHATPVLASGKPGVSA